MYLIISGTNRRDSYTLRVAELYHSILQKKNIDAPVLSLVGLELLERNASVLELEKKWLLGSGSYQIVCENFD